MRRGEDAGEERTSGPAGAAGLAVRLSFVAGLVGLVLGVGLGRSGSGDAFIARDPEAEGKPKVTQIEALPEIPEATAPQIELRGVHVPAAAWAVPSYRHSILMGIRTGLITAVQLDLKDTSGAIGHRTDVRLAHGIGAALGSYDLRRAVKQIHRAGARVIGRIATFRDPILAGAAIARGQTRRLVHASHGRTLRRATNGANPVVRRYNIDLAVEAAGLGVDDILYDHVRLPRASGARLRLPGLQGSARGALTSFVARTRSLLREHGTRIGVTVPAPAGRSGRADRSIVDLAGAADFLAPMLYPSSWERGDHGVDRPERNPYRIVRRSLASLIRSTEGTGVHLVPWLQDFSVDVRYTAARVRAQIRAVSDSGVRGWLLWNPNGSYTGEALPRSG